MYDRYRQNAHPKYRSLAAAFALYSIFRMSRATNKSIRHLLQCLAFLAESQARETG